MVILDNFLGCFKLRTGCLIIGYCHVIFSLLFLIWFGIGVVFTVMIENQLPGEKKATNEMVMAIAIYICIVCAINFPLHVVLLVGVHQKRPRLLYVYLVAMIPYLVITFMVALIVTVINPSRGYSCMIFFGCNIYYLMVVQSHREEMESPPQLMVVYGKASERIPMK